MAAEEEVTVRVRELYAAVLGESSWVGWPAVLVRLSGCNLRCSYCDTVYAYQGGRRRSLSELLTAIARHRLPRVLLTGGEPLLQPGAGPLLAALRRAGYQVMLETNGSLDVSLVPPGVRVVIDIKTPGSGEAARMDLSNLRRLRRDAEIKFVLVDREDYLWSRRFIREHKLIGRQELIFSPAFGLLSAAELARWIVRDRLPVRLGFQLHQYLFGREARRK